MNSSEQFDPRIRRIQALHTYTIALEQGNLEAASAVLRLAEHDAALERLIVELHMASLETASPVCADDVIPLQSLLRSYELQEEQEEVVQSQLNGVSALANSFPSIDSQDNQESLTRKGQEAMSTTTFAPNDEQYGEQYNKQEKRHQPQRKGKKYRRVYTLMQTIAAVLVVGMIVGGFVLLLTQRHSATSGSGSGTTYPLIVAADSQGSVYALQPGTGTLLWHYATHQEVDTIIQQNGVTFVATSANSGYRPDTVYAFRSSDGKLLWKRLYPLLDGYAVMAIDDGAIAISGGEGDGSLDVVKASNGSLLWRFVPDKKGVLWSNPLLGEHNHVLYIHSNNGIKAFQMSTGKLLWTAPTVPEVQSIFFTGNALYALDVNLQGIYSVVKIQNGVVEKTLKLPADEQPTQNGFHNDILYVNKGYIYGKTEVCAVRIMDGTQLWCSPQSKALNTSNVFMPVTIMNNTFYYYQTYQDGVHNRLQIIALHVSDGTLDWHWISQEKNLYNSTNLVGIVGYDNVIYLTTSQGIFAFRSSDGHLLWHLLTNKDLESFALPSVPE